MELDPKLLTVTHIRHVMVFVALIAVDYVESYNDEPLALLQRRRRR